MIVGTIRIPPWMGRLPPVVWVFVALAILDSAYRIWQGPISLTDATSLVLSVIGGAAFVLLPAAILLGPGGAGRTSWIFQGALALAGAEILGLVGRDVLDVFAHPDLDISATAPDSLLRSMVVEISVALLRIFGLSRIGFGLRAIAGPARPFGRILYAAPAAALAVLLFADLLTIQVSQAAPATGRDAVVLGYNLLILVAGAITLVLWAWIASLAYRQDGQTWRLTMIGAGAIALASVIIAIGWIVAFLRADWAPMILTWFGLTASAVRVLGAVSLVLGLGRGFESIGTVMGSEATSDHAPDTDQATGPMSV
ncbi:MAG: hypothetical protein ABI628_06125 [Chloroflexota bacterium]